MDYMNEIEKLEKQKEEIIKEALKDDSVSFKVWSKYVKKERYDYINDVDKDSIIYTIDGKLYKFNKSGAVII